ncbi:MAG: M1 family aminopeptidase [Pseudomonadota bacterium]
MWLEFFKFDLRYQLRQPLLWLCGLVFALMAWGIMTSDAVMIGGAVGNINRNAPVVIVQLMNVFCVFSMFIATIFISGTVLRDTEVGIADMLFATPMRKRDYLIGRFAAGLLACLCIMLLVALGMMIAPYMPWVDAQRVGAFSLAPYAWSFAVFIIPNLIFIGALLMLLAATTRSVMLVYVGVIGFLVLRGVAGTFTQDVSNEWIVALVDPFGGRAFGRMVRYYSAAESNAGLPALKGFLLANRVLWTGIALGLLGATVALFKPQRAGTAARVFGRARPQRGGAPRPLGQRLSAIVPQFSPITPWLQCWQVLRFDAIGVFKSVPFLVLLLIGVVMQMFVSSQSGNMYGTATYAVTHNMIQNMQGSFAIMLIIILTFYAGELIFKERQAGLGDVIDAMPAPNWAAMVAKCMALIGVIAGFQCAGIVAAVVFQLIKGGAPIELMLYVKGVALVSVQYALMAMFALAMQVFTNNKFIGYGVMIAMLVVTMFVMGPLHLTHNLYAFGSLPGTPYSDMNGYGHFLRGWAWFALYWTLFTVALLLVAQSFWVRGLSLDLRSRAALAAQRLRGATGVALAMCLLGFGASGAWIFYNTNVLNHYEAADVAMDKRANYERLYRKYKDLPLPKITQVQSSVDIFPEELRVAIKGHYLLQNKTKAPIDTLRIQEDTDVETRWTNLPQHKIVVDDKTLGFRVLTLAEPLAPGATLGLDFVVDVRNPGFTNSGAPGHVNYNGTFFTNQSFFPHFGYNHQIELKDRNERRKRGLGEPERMAKLEDSKAYADNVISGEADWIKFDTTVSTSGDQIALAPGYLDEHWEQGGRRYYHYAMDQPMMPFFAILSARWEVKKGDWHGMPIEIYYDKKHAYNVDRMIASTKKSLDYYGAQFTPYQHKQVRILEFPNYQSFAQSFANTIPYSESIGFIADLRKDEDIDYVFYITAHELAHQWWGHQVIGAKVQGATVMMESLAQYSALMVMEKEYGREKMRRFLRFELDGYLRNRGSESVAELPLSRVEGQQYIHYNKGSMIFYRLRDEIGEAALNSALKRYLEDKRYQQAPYTTTLELLDYIRAVTPKEKHALIADMFEKIVFYDNRVTEATTHKRADGQWDVTMTLHLAKVEADGKGKETPRVYDEPVEIGVFARAAGAKEKDERVLLIDKRMLQGSDPTVTVTVKEQPFEVGVDPYNKLIDRVSSDNRKQVSVK